MGKKRKTGFQTPGIDGKMTKLHTDSWALDFGASRLHRCAFARSEGFWRISGIGLGLWPEKQFWKFFVRNR